MFTKTNKFCQGQQVKVRPGDEIVRTLDTENKLDHCLFMEQMFQYCGQQFEIIKVIRNVYHRKMLRALPLFYMLKDITCNGEVESFKHPCDRTCYLIWHEKWLDEV